MADYTVVKRVRSPDGKSEFEFCLRTDGHFQYFGHSEITEDGYTFWTPTAFSGLFDSLESAERDAAADASWLREELKRTSY